MIQAYRRANVVVFLIHYHFVFCPIRRRKVLTGEIENEARNLLSEKAVALGCEILALEIRPDHVHLCLSCPPTLSPGDAMFWLKGYSSRTLRAKHPILRRMPSMWTRSFFVSTARHVSSKTIQRYIEEQKTR